MPSEATVIRDVRETVAERDAGCRLVAYDDRLAELFGLCDGILEWAHLESNRRSLTRGMDPEERHTTELSAMMCRKHHRAYDAHRFSAAFLTLRGADGPMLWFNDECHFAEGIR